MGGTLAAATSRSSPPPLPRIAATRGAASEAVRTQGKVAAGHSFDSGAESSKGGGSRRRLKAAEQWEFMVAVGCGRRATRCVRAGPGGRIAVAVQGDVGTDGPDKGR
jgi:hypothetical protein